MSYTIETLTSEDGQYRFTVYQDYDCESHRSDTNLGTFLTWYRNYNSPDTNDFPSPDDFEEWWREVEMHPAYVRLPVFRFEHSGVAYSTGGFNDRWDSGQVGWIFTTPATIEECGTPPELFEEALKGEVEYYSKWANGECYGYTIEKVSHCECCGSEQTEEQDSCWGFIGAITEINTDDLPADLVEKIKASYYTEDVA